LACLPDVKTGEEVLLGTSGVIQNCRKGQVQSHFKRPTETKEQIVVDHSTVSASLSEQCYQAAKQRGAFFLDAPISGGNRQLDIQF